MKSTHVVNLVSMTLGIYLYHGILSSGLYLYRANEKVFFTFGFAKNERENIDSNELKAIKALAAELLAYTNDQIEDAIEAGALKEIKSGGTEND